MTVDTDTTGSDTDDDSGSVDTLDDQSVSAAEPDDSDQDDGDDSESSDGRGGNSEAAKYRHKLRDTETERDGLRGQLDAQRQAVLAAAAAAKRVSPELIAKTVEINDLLDENGLLDPAKAAEVIDDVIKTYGLPDMRSDGSGGRSRESGRKAERVGWGSVISGNVRTQR